MEYEIIVDLKNKENLIETYNNKICCHKLINYLVKNTHVNSFNKVIINKYFKDKIECVNIIKNSIEYEYKKSTLKQFRNNCLQILLLILGIVFLFISTKIEQSSIWHEIFIIGGWVPIWEMIHIEIFSESLERKTRRSLKRLMEADFIINEDF